MPEPQQPINYMLSALLIVVKDAELAYHMMLKIWNEFNFKRHYRQEENRVYEFGQNFSQTLGNYITFFRPKIAQKLNDLFLFDMAKFNLYAIILSNFGFTGQDGGGLPIEAALRLLEYYLLTYSPDDEETPLLSMLMNMLEICEDKILAMENKEELCRYVCFGRFIEDCLTQADLFKRLVYEYVVKDQQAMMNTGSDLSDYDLQAVLLQEDPVLFKVMGSGIDSSDRSINNELCKNNDSRR